MIDRLVVFTSLDHQDGVVRMTLRGAVDVSAEESLCDSVAPFIDHSSLVLVDLTALEFIDSGGVEALARLQDACRTSGTEMMILPGIANVQRVFDLAAVAHLFTFVDEGGRFQAGGDLPAPPA